MERERSSSTTRLRRALRSFGACAKESPEGLSYEEGKQRALEAYRRRIVKRCLRATRGNVTRAAEMCGLTRAAFQRIMRSLGLDRRQFSGEG